MTDRHTIVLRDRSDLEKALQGVRVAYARSVAKPDKPWAAEVRQRTRTDEQNRALHDLIGQILKQRPALNGLRMTKESYKAIFMQALGHEGPMLPTLAGDGFFPMGLSTSKLTVGEFSDLLEFVLAWCAEQGLTISHFDAKPEALNRARAA